MPRTIQSHCGFSLCWVWLWHAERKCALLCTPVSLFSTICCIHSSTAASSSLQNFPNSFKGTGGLEGIQVLKNGGKVGFFVFFLKFQSLFAEISNIQNIKDKQENKNIRQTSSGGHRLWTEERSMVYIAQCNCHLKVELRFFSSENWPTIKAAGLHNKSVIRKFDKAPESNWVPILKVTRRIRAHRGQWLGATGHTYS